MLAKTIRNTIGYYFNDAFVSESELEDVLGQNFPRNCFTAVSSVAAGIFRTHVKRPFYV